MTTSDQKVAGPARANCPLCGAQLENSARCHKCDWVAKEDGLTTGRTNRDLVAALLNVIPGLGYIYKGHVVMGLLLMLVATPLVIGFGLLYTMFAGWLLWPIYWAWVMLQVYWAEDVKLAQHYHAGHHHASA